MKKEISSVQNWKKPSEKLLCVLLVHLTGLHLSLQEALGHVCSCGIGKVIFGRPQRAMVKKKISSVKNFKEAFLESSFCSDNSSHKVTVFPSRSLSIRLVLGNLQGDIWKPIESYAEKVNTFS